MFVKVTIYNDKELVVMLINSRCIDAKLRPSLHAIMHNPQNSRITSVCYHLLEGESGRNYADTLVILEVILCDHGHSEYRLIRDNPAEGSVAEEIEIFRLPQAAMCALLRVLSPNLDANAEPEPTYDPSSQYVVSRKKSGRPRRVLTTEEQQHIKKLRAQGMGINAISAALKINNRRVMEYCKSDIK